MMMMMVVEKKAGNNASTENLLAKASHGLKCNHAIEEEKFWFLAHFPKIESK